MNVVICEKPSQAANVRAAVGATYGLVLAAQGHLLRLEEPQEVNDAWKKWNNDVLVPPSGRYGYRPDEGGGKARRLAEIKAALATADRVIIATDCDREGQAIGESLVRHFGFKGTVLRAMFTAEDPKSLSAAFAAASANETYRPLYDAAVARQQADQIFNLTLTRVASNSLRPSHWKGAIGIGRVKTPTLGLICARELEITAFKARAFFELAADVAGAAGTVELWHRPRGETRLFDKATAAKIAVAAKSYQGPLSVGRESKRALPPRPFDLPSLQKTAGKWGWSAKKVLDTTQALYETHKIVSYPRAETRFLPEALIGQAPSLLAALRGVASIAGIVPAMAEIRTGKGAVYSDKGLAGASHHAIIPNVNVAERFVEIAARLNDDERRLFDLIARGWLAAVSPDHEFDETVMSITVPVPELAGGQINHTVEFSTTGRVVTAAGWRLVFAKDDDATVDAGAAEPLPALIDGEMIEVGAIRVDAKMTTPPSRYGEGDLIDAMQNAWRLVPEGPERERLRMAKGIGTPATRDGVIEGLKAQGLCVIEKNKLKPTEVGLWLYGTLLAAVPELVDPGATARLETRLDAVLEGGVPVDTVIAEVVARTGDMVRSILAAAEATARPAVKRPPTAKMLDAARAKAKREGGRLPKGLADDFDACRAYLGPMREAPADGPRLASEKQVAWIRSLVGRGATPPEGFPDAVTASAAGVFLDAAVKPAPAKVPA